MLFESVAGVVGPTVPVVLASCMVLLPDVLTVFVSSFTTARNDIPCDGMYITCLTHSRDWMSFLAWGNAKGLLPGNGRLFQQQGK
jgi:hypothetical protein